MCCLSLNVLTMFNIIQNCFFAAGVWIVFKMTISSDQLCINCFSVAVVENAGLQYVFPLQNYKSCISN